MITLRYVIKKGLEYFDDDTEITTGLKSITIYDLDTHSLQLVELCQLNNIPNNASSKSEIQNWLNNNGYDEYKLEEL